MQRLEGAARVAPATAPHMPALPAALHAATPELPPHVLPPVRRSSRPPLPDRPGPSPAPAAGHRSPASLGAAPPDAVPTPRQTPPSQSLLARAGLAGRAASRSVSRATFWAARPLRASARAEQRGAAPALGWLARMALLIEICLFGLIVIAPLGNTTQSISPLARAWAWIFAPARLIFPGLNLRIGTLPDQSQPVWPGEVIATVFAALLILACAALAVVLLRCLWQHGSRRRHLALALVAAAVLGGTLILLPTLPSNDIYSYIIYGRIAALHHANPLVAVPADFPSDPFRTFVYWRSVRSIYGPVWLMVSSGITGLAEALGGSLATYVLLFKLLGLACHLLNMLLIWGILSVIAPRRRLVGTLLYGWNPLALLEFCSSAHNDALMLTFLLAGVLLLVRRWEVPALVAIGLSIATKYVPLALLPFYLFYVVRQAMFAEGDRLCVASRAAGALDADALDADARRSIWADRRLVLAGARAAGWRLGVVLGVVVVATLPYWAGPGTLQSVLYSPPAERLDNSLLQFIAWPLQAILQTPFGVFPSVAAVVVDTTLKIAALLGFVALWLYEFRRAKSLPGALDAWGWTLLWYVLVASGWFWPWYVTWVLAVVALLPWSKLSVTALLLSGGVLVLYAFAPLSGLTAYAPVYQWRALLEFGPAAAYLLWVTLARRWSAPRGMLDNESEPSAPAVPPIAAEPPATAAEREDAAPSLSNV
ncbi:MAG TPA: hypothetical protein VIG30_06035 [Ktedonobacterales bacterium]